MSQNTDELLPTGAGASELVNVIADGVSITRRPGLVPAPGVTFNCFDRDAALGHTFYKVLDDGTIWAIGSERHSVLTTPGGLFRSVKVLDDALCVEVERDGRIRTERFDPRAHADTLESGEVLNFTHVVAPTPPSIETSATKARLLQARFRVLDTKAMHIDTGRGATPIPFTRRMGDRFIASPPAFSGDLNIRAIGWLRPSTQPLWRIEQDAPQPFTLLRATTEWRDVW